MTRSAATTCTGIPALRSTEQTMTSKAIGTGVIVYDFLLDKPAALGPAVTARHVAVEADWYMDWKLNQNFTLSLVAAFASPGQVVQQVYDRTKNFAYGMAFIAYSY